MIKYLPSKNGTITSENNVTYTTLITCIINNKSVEMWC